MRKDLPMPKAAVTPRKRLAENLQVLMKTAEKSSPEIAEAAQIGRKTMNNFLNGRFDPRLTLVEKVANTFGLTTWQLLAMDLSAIPAQPKQVLTLLERFFEADEAGRATILQVAEIASKKALGEL